MQFGAGVTVPFAQNEAPQVTVLPGIVQLVGLVPSQKPPHTPKLAQAGRPLRGAPATVVHVPT